MKQKILFLTVIGLVIGALLIWWKFQHKRTSTSSLQPIPVIVQSPPEASKKNTPTSPVIPHSKLLSKGEKFNMLPILSASSIVFYGKVIDQDGKPLAGVEVIGRTGSKVAFYTEEHRSYQVTTGADGLFVFEGFKGSGLAIDLKKSGYNFASNYRSFLYSAITGTDRKRHEPDPKNPVVFTMFKSLGAEPMIHYVIDFTRFTPDGNPIRIDLKNGKIVKTGGDLLISVQWENEPDSFKQDLVWSAVLKVENGGLIEGTKDQYFLAPASGYKELLEYHFGIEDRGSKIFKDYYVSFDQGKCFARIVLVLDNVVFDKQARMRLTVWLNPSSRNLEYDPRKSIKR
jgi:hypothetical protein